MDITVTDGEGLPSRAFLSIRVGDVRRQMQFKAGDRFHFDLKAPPRSFIVDVFEKVGSKQINLADLKTEGPAGGRQDRIEIVKPDGPPITLGMHVLVHDKLVVEQKPKPHGDVHREAAMRAKTYLDGHAVQRVLQGMVQHLLAEQPEDPVDFMSGFLSNHGRAFADAPHSHAPGLPRPRMHVTSPLQTGRLGVQPSALPKMSAVVSSSGPDGLPLLGRMPEDWSGLLPDLTDCLSVTAGVLREDGSLYERLKDIRTAHGVSLAQCIKPGVDNQGHRLVNTIGLVAGDDSCYEAFREVFDPVLSRWHGNRPMDIAHPSDPADVLQELRAALPRETSASSSAAYVRVSGRRSLTGLRMAPSMSREERREVERVLTRAFQKLPADLAGEYQPLCDIQSQSPQPHELYGMLQAPKTRNRQGMVFQEPDSAVLLSAGFGRHWPEARGVFTSNDGRLTAWVNESEHLQLFAQEAGGKLEAMFELFLRAERIIRQSLLEVGFDFAKSRRLGYLAANPSNIGTGLQISMALRLPRLGELAGFFDACRHIGLLARRCTPGSRTPSPWTNDPGLWEIANSRSFGSTSVEQALLVMNGCQRLLGAERRLAAGEAVEQVLGSDGMLVSERIYATGSEIKKTTQKVADLSSMPGLGSEDYPGFPADACPEDLVDLSGHHSLMADVLRANRSLYLRLKDLKTKKGVTFARCIKPGVDTRGHPIFKIVGAVAGDADCYEVFRDFFDPLISLRHKVFAQSAVHPSDLDCAKVSDQPLDPTQKYVRLVRVGLSRNLRDLRMAPAMDRSERREAERVLSRALLAAELEGQYLPLRGSMSYVPRLGGMTESEETILERQGLLFREPDAAMLLSCGFGREWPDARGVFTRPLKDLVAWVNEEDHLRLLLTSGTDLRNAFRQLCDFQAAVHAAVKEAGHDWASNARLGFTTVCPSNLGTSLRAEVFVRLPLLAARLRNLCPQFGLHARDASRDRGVMLQTGTAALTGTWAISAVERLGVSEVQQINAVAAGVRWLISAEQCLERGDPEPPLPGATAAEQERGRNFADEPGLGEDEVIGFPVDECPAKMPDLAGHHSTMAHVLRKEPRLYAQLRSHRTASGVTLARCMKPGIDCAGHPMVRPVGAVAGDAECYVLFKDFFDPIIRAHHAGYPPSNAAEEMVLWKASPALDPSALLANSAPMDPSQRYAISSRVRFARNVDGFHFPPALLPDERLEVEHLLTQALSHLTGNFKGEYCPLVGSSSFPSKIGGMTDMEEQLLAAAGLHFQAPDAAIVLAGGYGRCWPHGRGIFRNEGRTAGVWINEEDHARFIVTHSGGGLQEAYRDLCEVERQVQEALREAGKDYAFSERLGFLTSCPSNLGSGGLRATVLLQLPLLGAQGELRSICKGLGVQVRTSNSHSSGHVWNVGASAQLGRPAGEPVQRVLSACRTLIEMEKRLEPGS